MDTATKLKKNKRKLQELDRQLARSETNERKNETRRKILVGAYFLNMYRTTNKMENLKKKMDGFLTKDADRALFDLDIETKFDKE
jgi:hypothetical protein